MVPIIPTKTKAGIGVSLLGCSFAKKDGTKTVSSEAQVATKREAAQLDNNNNNMIKIIDFFIIYIYNLHISVNCTKS